MSIREIAENKNKIEHEARLVAAMQIVLKRLDRVEAGYKQAKSLVEIEMKMIENGLVPSSCEMATDVYEDIYNPNTGKWYKK